ncbi:DNA damage-binding 2 [Gossypium australe]|uniref:DNA damage-binding 2 n=1 Tax=Gossypium australe TaxID=47621 RepID=A0A5B6UKM5_9ROSI|nr:DNA damage-binding 2 [Gossypium australe]
MLNSMSLLEFDITVVLSVERVSILTQLDLVTICYLDSCKRHEVCPNSEVLSWFSEVKSLNILAGFI